MFKTDDERSGVARGHPVMCYTGAVGTSRWVPPIFNFNNYKELIA